jgi:tetratricopeptide (TPR) repeat protein
MRIWMYLALSGALISGAGLASDRNCFDDEASGLAVSSAQGARFAEAVAAQKRGDYTTAESLLRALVSDLETSTPVAGDRLGLVAGRLAGVLFDAGSYVEAEGEARRALQLIGASFGDSHGVYGAYLGLLGSIACARGRCREAEEVTRRGVAIVSRTCGEKHAQYAVILGTLAGILYRQGEVARAIPVSKRVVSILESQSSSKSELALAYQNLAMLCLHEANYSEAREYLKKAMAVWERTVSPNNPFRISAMNMALLVAVRERKFDEAMAFSSYLLPLARASIGSEHPDLAAVLNNVAAAYAGSGQPERAAELLAQAVGIYAGLVEKRHIHPQEPQYIRLLQNYVEALKKAHRKMEARRVDAEVRNLLKPEHTIDVPDLQRKR